MRLICAIVGHRRYSQRTWHDGLDWRSSCRRCRAPMVKIDQDWRAYRVSDHDQRRYAKPEAGLTAMQQESPPE